MSIAIPAERVSLPAERIALPAEPFEWHEQKELLKHAALVGCVSFLKECVSHNAPNDYYLSQLKVGDVSGNFLHIALAVNNADRTLFIKATLRLLNPQVIHQLMVQATGTTCGNPLHMAAFHGNVEAVKLLLEFYTSQPSSLSTSSSSPQPASSSSSLKPWLQKNLDDQNPCHMAVVHRKEECALKIFEMDMEKLSQEVDDRGIGLLMAAVVFGLNNVAFKILNCTTSFSCSASQFWSPLHMLPKESDRRDICRQLLEKAAHLVEQITNDGLTLLHTWVQWGKVWPFKYTIQECNNIIPNIRRRVVNLMSKTERNHGMNPFHWLAASAPNEEDAVTIMEILIEAYKIEAPQSGHLLPPWLAEARDGSLPLHLCLDRKYQKLAICILLEEKVMLMKSQGHFLVYAVRKGCPEVATLILDSVDKENWTELKDENHCNVLHVAPCCKKEFFQQLINGNPKLLEGIDKYGRTVLHIWAELGYVWPFEYILKTHGANHLEWNSRLLSFLRKTDEFGNTVFHYAVRNKKETANHIVQLLANSFKKLFTTWKILEPVLVPWLQPNSFHHGALHEAIMNHHQEVALTILLLFEGDDYHEVLDYYKPECSTLFLAMEYNCLQVARNIMTKLRKRPWTPYLKDVSNGQSNFHLLENGKFHPNGRSILHLAPSCTDKEFGEWLVAQAPEFILEQDINGKTPLDIACVDGADWIIRAMLQTNPTSIFDNAPLAWISICEKGHISAICAFIDNFPGRFKDHCVKHKDSPLHHIKLPNIRSYEEFLKIPHMKNLVNIQNSNGETPLHCAIRHKNIHLTEVLLNNEDVLLDIKDDNDKQTARYLLRKLCKEDEEWKSMCQENGFDLSMKLTYLQRKTNSIDTRNTLSVVAALLATITFTAGFTLPGGVNQDTGQAILAKKTAFLVFLIFDTIALCISMLVLTCLIWSMVYDPNKSMFLIDRSMKLLMVSLYSTMIAFMCGVFIVVSQKSMWAAILVIVICSLLGLSIKRSLLYKLVDKLIPSPTTNDKDLSHCLLEMGKLCSCRGESSCLKCN